MEPGRAYEPARTPPSAHRPLFVAHPTNRSSAAAAHTCQLFVLKRQHTVKKARHCLGCVSTCRWLRNHLGCPIVFLTARMEDIDKLVGFEANEDDYALKSFSLAFLSKHPGQASERERINDRVWGWDCESTQAVDAEFVHRVLREVSVESARTEFA